MNLWKVWGVLIVSALAVFCAMELVSAEGAFSLSCEPAMGLNEYTCLKISSQPEASVLSTSEDLTLRKVLEIGLIAMIVIIVVVGIIIGLSKLRDSDDDEEESDYY